MVMKKLNIHFCSVIIKVQNTSAARKYIRDALGWLNQGATPLNTKMSCKGLTQKALYMFSSRKIKGHHGTS